MPSRKGAARVPADAPADGAALLSAFASMMSGSGNALPDFVSTGLPSARHVSALREAVEVMLRRATAGKSPTAHIERARSLKAEGNEKFLAGDYRAALAAHHASYLWASGFAEWGGGPRVPEAHESFWTAMMPRLCAPASADELQQLRELRAAHHANLALCHMKLQQHGARATTARAASRSSRRTSRRSSAERSATRAWMRSTTPTTTSRPCSRRSTTRRGARQDGRDQAAPRPAREGDEERFQKLFKPEKTAAAAPSEGAAVVAGAAASEGAAAAAAAAPDDGDGDDGAAERAAQAALEEKLRRETAQLTAERTSLLAEREALLSRQDTALRERALAPAPTSARRSRRRRRPRRRRRRRRRRRSGRCPHRRQRGRGHPGGGVGGVEADDDTGGGQPTAAAAATTTPAITVKVVNAGATGGKVDADGVKRDDKGAVAETYFKLKRTTRSPSSRRRTASDTTSAQTSAPSRTTARPSPTL